MLFILAFLGYVTGFLAAPYAPHSLSAPFSEGRVDASTIRTALKYYARDHQGAYPDLTVARGNDLQSIGIGPADLEGMYFRATDYSVTSTKNTFTVTTTATFAGGGIYIIDEIGRESGNFEEVAARYHWWRERREEAPYALPFWGAALLLTAAGTWVSVVNARRRTSAKSLR